MLSPDEVLIEYVAGQDSLYIFLMTDEVQHVEVVSIDSTLWQHVDNFNKGLAERNREFYIPAAYALYSVLVEPIIHVMPDKDTWVIIADDRLNGIPFGALISEPRPIDSNYF